VIPTNALSTSVVFGRFLSPDNLPVDDTVDYELGGVGLSDASQGLMYQTWTAYISGTIGDPGTAVYIKAPNTADQLLFSLDGLTAISLAFDQNMHPFIAYTASGVSGFWWYDATIPGQIFTDLPVGSSVSKCSLDDKREVATLTGTSDILIVYIRTDNLYYRQERDRYLTERILLADVSTHLIAPRVGKVGMTEVGRVQFYLYGSLLPP
jgi:hypothetical protein